MLWVALRRTWSRGQDALFIVQPEAVVAWHRKPYRRYWTALSRGPGRAKLDPEVRELIVQMACENPTRGAPRIHGELAKLGFNVSERRVSGYLPRIRPGRGTCPAWSERRYAGGTTGIKRCESQSPPTWTTWSPRLQALAFR